MDPFDRIMGYETIRKELERTADVLKNTEYYTRLGSEVPRGLLLYGRPGVGKTTMARALIDASGRKVFLCRRDRPDGDFVWAINRTFSEAAEAGPSVVFLDDLDKFSKSEEGCSNEEEFAAVQAGIDSLQGKDVFVLATANEIERLPDSLLRPGRFDKTIGVKNPTGEEARSITGYYLSGKVLAPDVEADAVADILSGNSCAVLEAAVNAAGILAGFERAEAITMKHLILGCIEVVHQVPPDLIVAGRKDSLEDVEDEMTRAAWHEAGHAVVSELLRPGSVTLVCIHERRNDSLGFTAYGASRQESFAEMNHRAICGLAGNAALEQRFGSAETGAAGDLEQAVEYLREAVENEAYCGFPMLRSHHMVSNERLSVIETAVSLQLQQLYSEAKRLLSSNMRFLNAVTEELLDKGLLTAKDIRRLKTACGFVG